ncbi:MAG: histidine phosphatase family protein [Chloroflexota bacterium]
MRLFMIRHGQSYVNLKEWDEGNMDMGLTELGHQQAEALGKWIPTEVTQIDALYVSTMKRAQETAEYVSNAYKNVTPIPEPRIREIGNNQVTKDPWPNEELPEYGNYWGSERPFHSITPDHPGGESLMHFRIRIGEFFEDLVEKHDGETVVAVCHGGVIEMAFDHMFNIGPWRRAEVFTKNTGISRFEYGHTPHREYWRIYYHSRMDHLIGIES